MFNATDVYYGNMLAKSSYTKEEYDALNTYLQSINDNILKPLQLALVNGQPLTKREMSVVNLYTRGILCSRKVKTPTFPEYSKFVESVRAEMGPSVEDARLAYLADHTRAKLPAVGRVRKESVKTYFSFGDILTGKEIAYRMDQNPPVKSIERTLRQQYHNCMGELFSPVEGSSYYMSIHNGNLSAKRLAQKVKAKLESKHNLRVPVPSLVSIEQQIRVNVALRSNPDIRQLLQTAPMDERFHRWAVETLGIAPKDTDVALKLVLTYRKCRHSSSTKMDPVESVSNENAERILDPVESISNENAKKILDKWGSFAIASRAMLVPAHITESEWNKLLEDSSTEEDFWNRVRNFIELQQ